MIGIDGEEVTEEPARTVFDPVHFSDLSCLALSPAHFKASVEAGVKVTKDMRIGTIVHHMVLGPHRTRPVVLYEDGEDRKGNAYKSWARAHHAANPKAELVTRPEWAEAKVIAAAVHADPQARRLLDGARREVSLTWDLDGILCETDGIDIVGDGYICDLKKTNSTEPGQMQRHGAKYHWHCQIVHYATAAAAHKIDTSKGLFVMGVEADPPHCVTVLQLSEPTINSAKRTLGIWLEKLRVARDNDHWPGYTQAVVPFDLPEWMLDEDDL